jgi:tetratricopeptide (TPR) repeat protein
MDARFRLVLVAALAFSAVACGSSAGSTSDTAATPRPGGGAQPLAQGVRPTENDQTREAEKALGLAAAAATPQAAAPHYRLALDSANAAIRLDANNPLGHRLAGEALLGLERPLEAAAALDRAEELRPIYALETEGIRERGWIDEYQRAQPFLQSGDYLKAAEVLEGANALYRQRPEIMVVLGQIYAQENQPDKAIVHLQRADSLITARLPEVDSAMATEWRTQQAEIPVTIAQAYIGAKRYDEASSTLAALAAAHPDNLLYARSLADVYAQSQKPDSATAVYTRLLERRELAPADLYQIGTGLYSIDRFAEAAGAFRKAAEAAPKDRDAFEMWARTLQLDLNRTGSEPSATRLAELMTAAQGWLALDPHSRVGMLILAQTTNKAKNEALTNELVRKMDALAIGVTDLQLRRLPEGGATLSGAIENYKASPGTQLTLTFTFFDKAGNALGTEQARVATGARDAKNTFSVRFSSDRQVDGYTYSMPM